MSGINEVIVGNVGTVYAGKDVATAERTFDAYVEQSKSHVGRAGDECVTWFQSGEIRKEFDPATIPTTFRLMVEVDVTYDEFENRDAVDVKDKLKDFIWDAVTNGCEKFNKSRKRDENGFAVCLYKLEHA